MRYTKCPTCGGTAEFVSENFKTAGILIARENEHFQKELEQQSRLSEKVFRMVEKKVEDFTSSELFLLYRAKLQQEIIAKQTAEQVIIDAQYFEADRISRDLEEGLKRMLGDF